MIVSWVVGRERDEASAAGRGWGPAASLSVVGYRVGVVAEQAGGEVSASW